MQQVATLFRWYCQSKLFLSSSLLSLLSLLSSYMLLTITDQCCSTQQYEQELNDQSLVIFPARLSIAFYFISSLFPAHPYPAVKITCMYFTNCMMWFYDMVVSCSYASVCFVVTLLNCIKMPLTLTC
jgi:hypothetical protein